MGRNFLNPKRDIVFGVSLVLLVAISIHLVIKAFNERNMYTYLEFLHETIVEMIDNEEDIANFEKYYQKFISQVESDSISGNELEKLAERIIVLRQDKENLNSEDIQKILPVAIPKKKDIQITISQTDNRKDWKTLTSRLKKTKSVCDSLEAVKITRLIVDKKIEYHQGISDRLKKQYTRDKLVFEKDRLLVRNNLQDNGNLPANLDKKLNAQIDSIIIRNEQISNNVRSIEQIQALLDSEKQRLEKHLETIKSTE